MGVPCTHRQWASLAIIKPNTHKKIPKTPTNKENKPQNATALGQDVSPVAAPARAVAARADPMREGTFEQ